ncbi:hypothetical protein ASG93_29495 [Paenibacillus sp. Soil787]|nr:hypothetical protein ASG93_29495 [Paenibacillus sp. Soil787]
MGRVHKNVLIGSFIVREERFFVIQSKVNGWMENKALDYWTIEPLDVIQCLSHSGLTMTSTIGLFPIELPRNANLHGKCWFPLDFLQ